MARTFLMLTVLIAIGCNNTPAEPQPKINAADAERRAEERNKLIESGNMPTN
ncbi:MAG: hypothetical protein ACJ8C4_09525 [Gemmataceae bacterium]